MFLVLVNGYSVDCDKLKAVKFIKKYGDEYSNKEAEHAVNSILGNKKIFIKCPNKVNANSLSTELYNAGFSCKFLKT